MFSVAERNESQTSLITSTGLHEAPEFDDR